MPRSAGPVRHLDLEDVAARVDAVERDRGERVGSPRLEAARQVVWLEPAARPREDAPAARHDPPDHPSRPRRRPRRSASRSPGPPGRPRSAPRAPGGSAGSWLKSASIWTTTRGPAVKGGAEAVQVRPAEALLGRAMEDPDARVGRRPARPRGDRCRRASRRRRRAGSRRAVPRGSRGDWPDVLRFVVGREDDPGAEPELRVGHGAPLDGRCGRVGIPPSVSGRPRVDGCLRERAASGRSCSICPWHPWPER